MNALRGCGKILKLSVLFTDKISCVCINFNNGTAASGERVPDLGPDQQTQKHLKYDLHVSMESGLSSPMHNETQRTSLNFKGLGKL